MRLLALVSVFSLIVAQPCLLPCINLGLCVGLHVGEALTGLHTTEHWPPCAIKAPSSSVA